MIVDRQLNVGRLWVYECVVLALGEVDTALHLIQEHALEAVGVGILRRDTCDAHGQTGDKSHTGVM